ncbi:uncharacterized protein METZ01_LOCUS236326, partial [marine metagenome]
GHRSTLRPLRAVVRGTDFGPGGCRVGRARGVLGAVPHGSPVSGRGRTRLDGKPVVRRVGPARRGTASRAGFAAGLWRSRRCGSWCHDGPTARSAHRGDPDRRIGAVPVRGGSACGPRSRGVGL